MYVNYLYISNTEGNHSVICKKNIKEGIYNLDQFYRNVNCNNVEIE